MLGNKKAYFHLPGLFEFYDFYREFLALYQSHREYFYDWCEIASIYGAPADCIWGGGRSGFGQADEQDVLKLMNEYGISARLTLSNSLLREEHLQDKRCNALCALFEKSIYINENQKCENGAIVASDLLTEYLKEHYPGLYLVSSTTKVLTDFNDLKQELSREDFRYAVPDFRLNKSFDKLNALAQEQKDKIEFLCNECCFAGCMARKKCYEAVSLQNLGEANQEHICNSPGANEGYRFSKAMKNPYFISTEQIKHQYLPLGFSNFKIEGRSLGSALILEFLLYYLTKPEYQLNVREELYLCNTLDLF